MKVNISKHRKNDIKKRKINIKVHKNDLFNFHSTVNLIILKWLKKYRKHNSHNTIPSVFYFSKISDMLSPQESFDFYINDNPSSEHVKKEWEEILEKMIWSFRELVKEDSPEHYYIVNGCIEEHKRIEYENRIKEGLDLFFKYYMHL